MAANKVFAISILAQREGNKLLAAEYDLTSFNFFQRGSITEFLAFLSKTAVERTQAGVRQKIEENGESLLPLFDSIS